MTDKDLDELIKSVLDTGIIHDLIPSWTADRMRSRLDEVLNEREEHRRC